MQGATEERIKRLEDLVKHAQITTEGKKKDVVGFGSKVTIRKDGASDTHEYTIVGSRPVNETLLLLQPYIRLKKEQVKLALSLIKRMPGSGKRMTPRLLLELAVQVDRFADLNYSKKRINTSSKVEQFFRSHNLLYPVETDP